MSVQDSMFLHVENDATPMHIGGVGSIRIVVAIFSYDGSLYFGVTGDRDHAPDVGTLTAGIEAGINGPLGPAGAPGPAHAVA